MQYEDHLIAEAHQSFWEGIGRYVPPATDQTARDEAAVNAARQEPREFSPATWGDIHRDDGEVKTAVTKDQFRSYLDSPITDRDVGRAIEKGASNSAPGGDRVSFAALKLLDQHSANVVATLFNDCVQARWAPAEWLTATVKPLYKLDATAGTQASLLPSNYRGISLLSCIGKAMERIIDTRYREYIAHFGAMDGAQGGFKSGWGTAMQSNPHS